MGRRCDCGEADLLRYRRRLSGPLLDRIDLMVDVQRPGDAELAGPPRTDSAAVRDRVMAARERAAGRRGVRPRATAAARAALRQAYDGGVLSPRGRARVIRVATTIADLEEHAQITESDLLRALALRQRTAAEEPVH